MGRPIAAGSRWSMAVATMFSSAEKLEAAERELSLRRRVYPNRVGAHRMSQALADRQIALMEAIAADYRAQVEAEKLF
jgi:hypothetical protein